MRRESQEHFRRRQLQREPLVRVTHVPWCMSGSLTRGSDENVPGIPDTCAARNLRIWKEIHARQI